MAKATTMSILTMHSMILAKRPKIWVEYFWPNTKLYRILNKEYIVSIRSKWLSRKLFDVYLWLYSNDKNSGRDHHHVYDRDGYLIDTLGCSWSWSLFTRNYSCEMFSNFRIYPFTIKVPFHIELNDTYQQDAVIFRGRF